MTLEEFGRQQHEYQDRAVKAQAKAAQALGRLLQIAERSDTGQAGRIAQFIAAVYNGDSYSFDLFELRSVDVEISDDMLSCMDALRWGKSPLCDLVPDGDRRIAAVCDAWGFRPRNA